MAGATVAVVSLSMAQALSCSAAVGDIMIIDITRQDGGVGDVVSLVSLRFTTFETAIRVSGQVRTCVIGRLKQLAYCTFNMLCCLVLLQEPKHTFVPAEKSPSHTFKMVSVSDAE